MTFAHLRTKIQSRYQRGAARYWSRRPLLIESPTPLVSFTFDDFPRSALLTGGAILSRFGLTGTFYASFGLMGQTTATGPIFVRQDLDVLLAHGHELGCHTFDHCHSWETNTDRFEESIVQNEEARRALIPAVRFKTFSYPISPPRPLTKQRVANHFMGCRGGGQTLNVGVTDSTYLAAYFLEKSRDNPEAVHRVIEQNRHARGWLILATHDISPQPTPYGCTPDFFEGIVRRVVSSGARVLPVGEALDILRAP